MGVYIPLIKLKGDLTQKNRGWINSAMKNTH